MDWKAPGPPGPPGGSKDEGAGRERGRGGRPAQMNFDSQPPARCGGGVNPRTTGFMKQENIRLVSSSLRL